MKRGLMKSAGGGALLLALALPAAGCRAASCVTGLGCGAGPRTHITSPCLWADTTMVVYSGVAVRVIRSGHDTTCVPVDGGWERRR